MVPDDQIQHEIVLRAYGLAVAFLFHEDGIEVSDYSSDGSLTKLFKWPDARHHMRQYLADKHGAITSVASIAMMGDF